MNVSDSVFAAVPGGINSVATWWVAERCGIGHATALRELKKLEASGRIRIKGTTLVNRSTLQRLWWTRAEQEVA